MCGLSGIVLVKGILRSSSCLSLAVTVSLPSYRILITQLSAYEVSIRRMRWARTHGASIVIPLKTCVILLLLLIFISHRLPAVIILHK